VIRTVSEPVPWPGGGPWIVAGTSAGVDWQTAAAALAAAGQVRVAAVAVGPVPPPGDLLLGRVSTWLQVSDGGDDPPSVEDVAGVVATLWETHGLVLVTAVPGLLVPVGAGGWTLADLAAALSAPVVVVTDSGPDAANHTTLALGALAGRGIMAAVITVGATADDENLPVTPAGRIPADAADRPDEFTASAPGWLNPILHATRGRPRTTTPPEAPPPGTTVSGRRVVLALLAIFASAVVAACGLALVNRTDTRAGQGLRFTTTVGPAQGHAAVSAQPAPRPTTPRPTLAATAVCPQYAAGVIPARADAATRSRINAAWKRIENWLARHAPKSRRALRPPATAERIDQIQRQMSVAFPADLVASLLRHNGVAAMGFDLPPFFSPMSVDEIASDWVVSCGVMANVTMGSDDWWHKAFVPFAADGGGGCLLVDQRAGGHGRVGEFYPEDGTGFERWPASITELLEKTARSLETGRPYENRYAPKVDAEGALDWEILQSR